MKKQSFSGIVLEGQKLGRRLGFPTANLDPKVFNPSWDKGVYSAEVRYKVLDAQTEKANNNVLKFSKTFLAVLFYGPKTVGNVMNNSLELHILDFNENIYGKTLEVTLLEFIRKPIAFTSLDALVEQIKADIEVATKNI